MIRASTNTVVMRAHLRASGYGERKNIKRTNHHQNLTCRRDTRSRARSFLDLACENENQARDNFASGRCF